MRFTSSDDPRGKGMLTVEILVRMHTRIQRRSPAGRIHTGSNLRRVILTPPLNQQRNRILRLRHTPHCRSRTLGRRRRHPHRLILRHHTLTDINVVRVKVIRDIRVATRPRLERLQLRLRLTHVAVEIVEVTEGLRLGAGVRVGRVEALVVLDEYEYAGFAGGFDEREVVGETLGGGFGDEDVVAALDGVEGDWVVC